MWGLKHDHITGRGQKACCTFKKLLYVPLLNAAILDLRDVWLCYSWKESEWRTTGGKRVKKKKSWWGLSAFLHPPTKMGLSELKLQQLLSMPVVLQEGWWICANIFARISPTTQSLGSGQAVFSRRDHGCKAGAARAMGHTGQGGDTAPSGADTSPPHSRLGMCSSNRSLHQMPHHKVWCPRSFCPPYSPHLLLFRLTFWGQNRLPGLFGCLQRN